MKTFIALLIMLPLVSCGPDRNELADSIISTSNLEYSYGLNIIGYCINNNVDINNCHLLYTYPKYTDTNKFRFCIYGNRTKAMYLFAASQHGTVSHRALKIDSDAFFNAEPTFPNELNPIYKLEQELITEIGYN